MLRTHSGRPQVFRFLGGASAAPVQAFHRWPGLTSKPLGIGRPLAPVGFPACLHFLLIESHLRVVVHQLNGSLPTRQVAFEFPLSAAGARSTPHHPPLVLRLGFHECPLVGVAHLEPLLRHHPLHDGALEHLSLPPFELAPGPGAPTLH